jgi:hypothetical protein
MATVTRKSSRKRPTAEKRAAQKAEEAAKVLHSFAASLNSLDQLKPAIRKPVPTSRNWWRLQSGRFKNDPTFPDFVAQVQAARRHEG